MSRALLASIVVIVAAGSMFLRAHGQTTVPVIWTYAVPQGAAALDDRITQMVRLYADGVDGETAGEAAAAIADTRPSGGVCILLQNFGAFRSGNPDYCVLSYHDDDAVPGPVYSDYSPYADISWWSVWTANGVSQSAAWMEDFIIGYNNESGPKPNRFHFDTESVLVECCSTNGPRVFDAMQTDAGRWDVENIAGFGETMAELFAKSNPWEEPLESPEPLDGYLSNQWMGHAANVGWPVGSWASGSRLWTAPWMRPPIRSSTASGPNA